MKKSEENTKQKCETQTQERVGNTRKSRQGQEKET